MLATAALSVVTAPALAVPCEGAKGRLTKCPKPAAGAIRCKDARGKFAKCPMPGTHPA